MNDKTLGLVRSVFILKQIKTHKFATDNDEIDGFICAFVMKGAQWGTFIDTCMFQSCSGQRLASSYSI